LYTVDVFPAQRATDREIYRIEIVLETVNGGIWDSTDEVDGQLRYRLCRPSRDTADITARELVLMGINADVRVGPPRQEVSRMTALPKSLRRGTPAASASEA
jgi:hypothetical protein